MPSGKPRRGPAPTYTFHGHGEDHARVIQQASGTQFNVEQAYFASSDATFLIDEIESWPRVSDLDAIELGVHRAAVSGGSPVPPYVERDIDVDLRLQIRTKAGLVLLIGPSTAGKSRAGYEAIQTERPSSPIFAPDSKEELRRALTKALLGGQECVIWLDDLERFLGDGGLTTRFVSLARNAGILLLATMRSQQYSATRNAGVILDDDSHTDGLANAAHVLDSALPIQVERRWSTDELQRAKDVKDDRVKKALDHSETYGIAEYLAAGPDLLEAWKLGQGGGNPRGWALVSAAVDVARAGVLGPIPLKLLREAHDGYVAEAGGPLLRAESFEDAVRWATLRRYGVTSLLVPTSIGEHYRPFDYLVDHATDEGAPIPEWIWPLARNHEASDISGVVRVAVAAFRNDRTDLADQILSNAASQSGGEAAFEYARFLQSRERRDEAEGWLQVAARDGYAEATTQLALILQKRGANAEAEELLRPVAESGDSHAAFHLAVLLRDRGALQEAETWYVVSSQHQRSAKLGLADVISNLGRTDEAVALLRDAAEDAPDAANLLGIVLDRAGETDEAANWWRRSAEAGDSMGAANLGRWHLARDEYAEAEEWTRAALPSDLPGVRAQLGKVLLARGLTSEGISHLSKDAEAGGAASAIVLASYYLEKDPGKWEDSERLLRMATEGSGKHRTQAMFVLGQALLERGQDEEGELLIRNAATDGHKRARYRLADLARARGNEEEANDHLRMAADAGEEIAACELASILWSAGKVSEARAYLEKSLAKGHGHAGCNLGTLLTRIGDVDGGVAAWKKAYSLGHHDVADRLARHFVKSGQGKQAAYWHGLAHGRKAQTSTGAKRNKKRKRNGHRGR